MDFEGFVVKMLNDLKEDMDTVKTQIIMQGVDIKQNTHDLTEHKQGVMQNRARLEVLEKIHQPLTVMQLIRRVLLISTAISTLCGAIYAISRVI